MPTIQSPRTQAGIMSFYDVQDKGPLLNPKTVLIIVVVFAIIIILLDHFAVMA